MQVHVIPAAWEEHKATLRSIRDEVFIQEQNVPREEEWDGEDEASQHFLAVSELGDYVGCARLLPSGQIGRMAVRRSLRGTGVGAALLRAVVDAASNQGFERLFLHAQSYAEPFYRKGGFLPYGDEFQEAGIAHIAMQMILPVAFEVPDLPAEGGPAIRPQAPRPQQLEPSKAQAFDAFDNCLQALQRVIASARRSLCIMSPYLDHELFDQPEIVDAISQLARSAPRVEISILILDSRFLVERGHQLLDLSRRLDEKITLRRLDESASAETSSFVCADLDAYWLLPNFQQYEGVCDTANPVTAQKLRDAFDKAWEKSREDPELRTLRL